MWIVTRVAESEVTYPIPKFPTPEDRGNEIWLLLKSMEIVVHSKKSLFQQKFQKKLYHFNRISQFRSVILIQMDSRSRTKKSDSQLPPLHCTFIGLTRERFVALGLPS